MIDMKIETGIKEGAKIILDEILLSIQYKSIPKPVLIAGVNNESINAIVKTTAKNLLCKNECRYPLNSAIS